MLITQFNNSIDVDNRFKNTFMFYDDEAKLHRLGDDYFDLRRSSYLKLLENRDQENKTSFRLFFIKE